MKLRHALFLASWLLAFSLTAQVKFKVKLLTDNQTYQVILKPDVTWDAPQNVVPTAQVTLVVPTGGFQVGNIINNKGLWNNNANIVAPPENPTKDYIVFGLQGITSAITFQKDIEVLLFSFKNNGKCTGPLKLIEHATDPFMPPNSQSVNVGNHISVIAAGSGVNAYTGNYNVQYPDCKGASGCGVQVFDIAMKSPTACGLANGSIKITATNTNGLALQYSIDKGVTFQSSDSFPNLAAGNLFEVLVRDIAAICIVNAGSFEMEGPLAAVITGVDKVNPDCDSTNGSITVHAYSEIGNPLLYAIGKPEFFQSANTFTGLGPGFYKFFVKDAVKDCVNEVGTYELEECPPEPCIITYELEKLPNDLFQISIITDTTWTFPNNITSSAQWTIKVPTGGFQVSNLTSVLPGVNFTEASAYFAPVEDPASDYISFILGSPGTQDIPFTKGQKVPLFTFENAGSCQGGEVVLMDNDTDPFLPPNSVDANVGQQLTVSGYGGADVPVCISNLPAPDCTLDPCKKLLLGFTANNVCFGNALTVTNTTTSYQPVVSWKWNWGDGSAVDTAQNPTHNYGSSGNYEIILTAITDGGCTSTYKKNIVVNPVPGPAPTLLYSICPGDTVQLLSPANVNAVWSPATGLSNVDSLSPFAYPIVTTNYTVVYSNAFSCSSSSVVKVEVGLVPAIDSVIATDLQNCDTANGKIEILASGSGTINYSIDNGLNWQNSNIFTNLAAGNYRIKVRYSNSTCQRVYSKNPVVLQAPSSASLSQVLATQPGGCHSNGSIEILATGGVTPLQYSIDGGSTYQTSNIFPDLGSGNYQVAITNANGSCKVVRAEALVLQFTNNTTIVQKPGKIEVCKTQKSTVKYVLSEKLDSFKITSEGVYTNVSIIDSLFTFDINPSADTTYYAVELRGSSNCVVFDTLRVIALPAPIATYQFNSPLCKGTKVNLEYTGNAGSSAKLTWGLDGGQLISQSDSTFSSPKGAFITVIWDSGGIKNISLIVEQGGCQANTSITHEIKDFQPGASMGITPVSACGSNTGAIKLSIISPGDYSFLWSGPGADSLTTQSINNLPGGFYTVIITDQPSGCISTSSGMVVYPVPVSIDSIITTKVTQCDVNSPNGELQVFIKGGDSPFTYKLYKEPEFNTALDSLTTTSLNPLFPGLPSGDYLVSIKTAKGCTDTMTAKINSISSSFFVAGSQVKNADCGTNNGSLTLQLSGGSLPFEYFVFKNGKLEAGNEILNANTLELTKLTGAEYNIVVADANGCVVSSSAKVGAVSTTLQLTATLKNPSCGKFDGSIELAGYPAGANFSWQNNTGMTLPSQGLIDLLPAGIYQVIVTDAQGCTSLGSYLLSASSPAEANIVDYTDASCGKPSGSLKFNVKDSGPYFYSVLNTKTTGLGGPGDTISISGFDAGSYVVEIVDTTSTCKTYLPVLFTGTSLPQITASTKAASACGISDASICLQLTKGAGPFTITADKGTVPGSSFYTDACVSNLYEGLVNLTITDSVGCTIDMSVNLPEQIKVTLAETDFSATNYTCPGEFGSIVSNTSHQYAVYDTNNFYIGKTPLTKMSAGVYKVVYEVGSCSAQKIVSISGPENWNISYTAKAESCAGNDGSLELSVLGGNSGYSYKWSTGDSTKIITGLKAGNSFSVTVTDQNNCTGTLPNIFLPLDCKVVCPQVFLVDTFHVLLQPGLNEICLPSRISNISGYQLTMNTSPYSGNISYCLDSTTFYSYGILLNLGVAPFRLESWQYKGKQAPKFTFNKLDELVAYLNILDPSGNWVHNNTDKTISGSTRNGDYGSLSIMHLSTNTILSLQVNTLAVAKPSIFVPQANSHVLVIRDPLTACLDTLYINRLIPPPALKDTMSVALLQGSVKTVCFSADGLLGTPISFLIKCISNSGKAVYKDVGQLCINVEGMLAGLDTACFEICDDKGGCKTIYLNLEVRDTSTDLKVYNAISPNGDGINDVLHIKNIDRYPDNHLYIFNRWGLQIFAASGYSNNNPWDGRFKNQELPDGSYFYLLNFKINGVMNKMSGYIEIRR